MAKLPLEGVRIADFTWVWAGPYCTLQLAHLGADVIRIETRTRPCVTRLLPPWPEGKPGINRSGYFNQYNQGKRSLTLNYAKPGALEVAHRLVEASDVVTNNFASGVMEKMGLGYEALRKIKPDLIMISLSGYGDTGPFHEYVAYGPAQVPLSGLSSLTGYKGWPPMHAGFSYADPNAGVHGAFAILAALYHRKKTGEGQYIDMSQWECAMGLLPEGIMEYTMNGHEPARDGNRDPLIAPHGVFPSKDRFENTGIMIDMWVSIVAADDAEFGRLGGRDWEARDGARSALRHRRRAQAQRGRTRSRDRRVDLRAQRRRGGTNPPGGGRGGRGLRAQQVHLGGSSSDRARLLGLSRPSRSRRAAALRNPVADEPHRRQRARAGAAYRTAYRRGPYTGARL